MIYFCSFICDTTQGDIEAEVERSSAALDGLADGM